MSIHVMCKKEEATYTLDNFPGWDTEKHGPLYMLESHKGLVLDTGEYNGYDDSDFYAVVWNPEKRCTERIVYATTRGWSYPNGATVDATPEVRAEYEAWCEEQRKIAEQMRREAEAKDPKAGKRVRVISGRKYLGQEGEVFWRGPNKFRTYYRNGYNRPSDPSNQVLGIRKDDGSKFFIPMLQVEVVQREGANEEL